MMKKQNTFKAGFIQFTPSFGNFELNTFKLLNLIKKTQITADLLVLPEMALTGYAFESKKDLKTITTDRHNKKTEEIAVKISEKTGAYIVIGYPEYTKQGFYNSAMLVNSNGKQGNYRKTHLFGGEKQLFLQGNSGFKVFETEKAKIGIMICFDWFFPEAARTLALNGAQVIAHPSNLVMPYCQTAMFTRSLENMVYTITSNRCGSENYKGSTLKYTGKSIIYSPKAEQLTQGDLFSDLIQIVDMDLELTNKNLNSANNIFTDRHPEFYDI